MVWGEKMVAAANIQLAAGNVTQAIHSLSEIPSSHSLRVFRDAGEARV
jgi:hypothetical protein